MSVLRVPRERAHARASVIRSTNDIPSRFSAPTMAAEKLKRKQWRSCSLSVYIEALPFFHSRWVSSVCARVRPSLVILLMIPILFKWVDWFMANTFCSDGMLDAVLWYSTMVFRYILYLYFLAVYSFIFSIAPPCASHSIRPLWRFVFRPHKQIHLYLVVCLFAIEQNRMENWNGFILHSHAQAEQSQH